MKNQLPRFPKRELDQKISLCVSKEMKEKWDTLTRKNKVKLPEMVRDYLNETLPEVEAQIKREEKLN